MFEQQCNGVCDDWVIAQQSPDNVYKLRVLDASGKCVLCSDGEYVTRGFLVRWKLSGRDKLKLRSTSKSYIY